MQPSQVPKRLHFTSDDFATYKDWIDRLPVTQPVQAGELMYKFLRYLFQVDLPPVALFKTLEYSQPILKYLWHGLRKYYLGTATIPHADKGHIIYLVNALEDLVVDHYAYFVRNQSNGGEKVPEAHAIAIQRAMYHLTHILLNHYQLSSMPPKGVWFKINRLYDHAKKFKFLDKKIIFNPPIQNLDTTIGETYIHALLLACCDPYQLRHDELEHLYQALFAWSKMAEIHKADDRATFIMGMQSDYPPHYVAFDKDKQPDAVGGVGLDTQHVCQHLREILTQEVDNNLTNKIIELMGERLLLYLSRTWSSPYNRKFPRWDEEGEVKVIVGFDAVYQKFVNIQNESDDAVLRDEKDALHPKEYIWDISNVALEGFCLEARGEESTSMQAKELLAIKPCNSKVELPWQLACARWVMRSSDSGSLLVGIEMLSPEVKVVDAYLENIEEKTLSPALMIPQSKSKYADYDVILPPVKYKTGDMVHINGDDFEYECEILEVPVLNDSFVQAKVKYIKEIDHHTSEFSSSAGSIKKDIDKLWEEM